MGSNGEQWWGRWMLADEMPKRYLDVLGSKGVTRCCAQPSVRFHQQGNFTVAILCDDPDDPHVGVAKRHCKMDKVASPDLARRIALGRAAEDFMAGEQRLDGLANLRAAESPEASATFHIPVAGPNAAADPTPELQDIV